MALRRSETVSQSADSIIQPPRQNAIRHLLDRFCVTRPIFRLIQQAIDMQEHGLNLLVERFASPV